eukprot:3679959-Amphidinium_carterae.1
MRICMLTLLTSQKKACFAELGRLAEMVTSHQVMPPLSSLHAFGTTGLALARRSLCVFERSQRLPSSVHCQILSRTINFSALGCTQVGHLRAVTPSFLLLEEPSLELSGLFFLTRIANPTHGQGARLWATPLRAVDKATGDYVRHALPTAIISKAISRPSSTRHVSLTFVFAICKAETAAFVEMVACQAWSWIPTSSGLRAQMEQRLADLPPSTSTKGENCPG